MNDNMTQNTFRYLHNNAYNSYKYATQIYDYDSK